MKTIALYQQDMSYHILNCLNMYVSEMMLTNRTSYDCVLNQFRTQKMMGSDTYNQLASVMD